MSQIDETAKIAKGAIIGKNVTIGAFCVIGENVVIGDSTIIEPHCVISGKTTIGKNNHIFSHSALGSQPQSLGYKGEVVELIIGDGNIIREHTLFNTGTVSGGGKTVIGNNNFFMGYTHVAHDCIIGNNCIFANGVTFAGHVTCDDFAFIGGLTPIHQFCSIGTGVMIGGGSVITQDIPPYTLAEGNRAKVKGLNLVGLRRRIKNTQDIDELKRVYKILFRSNEPIKESAQKLLETNSNQYVQILCNFILQTKRGIPYGRTKQE
ncbi:acyl-ACP--UDP-N-acetylglucosamine O-acyltransferase [Arcobacter sp. FWKO B]|uniref:acyl-ACP--UDP-N-acetylglucosamine O-acyltransferase n=1 Tax=Arcobacter sp. FWKO B TaxID=2593672 RepID=UPI0018A33ED5|nr:acyl-ACP--UDP-N-acetylglucosamine O-acyltransferase [Arcobacter sp. FWKO B]QOG12212.1 acyl-ACP--UDP-N-acetylglucosamine O-acyltransferase [Arcobacter sp. FWKO B]